MTTTFDDIALALKLQANLAADHARDLEIVACRIGLTPKAIASVIGNRRLQADLVAEAYRIFRALAPVENTVRAVIATSEEWR
jgi:hypothetical protein